MRIAFMGTPEFSVPVLSELVASGHEVVCVYTQPPRPAGRGKKLRPSPVYQCAETYKLPIRTPENFKAEEDRITFDALDLDVAIIVAYGLILPKAILEAPRLGCLNLHASLLPRWRGAAPIHRAIMAGDHHTGIQVMQMEAGLDTGPVLLSECTPITPQDTTGSVHNRLSHIGAQLIPRALAALERGSLEATPQDEEGITYAHKITSEEARIDWSRPAQEIDYHIRGLSPAPGAWFHLTTEDGKKERIKCQFSSIDETKPSQAAKHQPGSVLSTDATLTIACGDGAIELHTLQRPGKAPQAAQEFLRGCPIKSGDCLE